MTVHLSNTSLFHKDAFINGTWCPAAGGARRPVHNPATGAVVAEVAECGAPDVDHAIAAAVTAQAEWRNRTGAQRQVILTRWHDLVMDNVDDLATLIVTEQGKPRAEAAGEIRYAASFLLWFAAEAMRAYGDVIPPTNPATRLSVIRQPVGVCAAITPWNFPAAMITRKAGPALAAGCAMIVKPSEDTPLTALALAELARQAGVPAGLLQVLPGDGVTLGKALCASPDIRKLSFTGSTQVGRILMAQSAATLKRLSLELGGNAPFIVFDDAHIEQAIKSAIAAKYRNAGQTCVCANRILVQDGIYDEFATRFARVVEKLQVGPGSDPDSVIGPLISTKARDKVEEHVNDAVSHGATIMCGGARDNAGELFYRPTVLRDATPAMRIAHEETFGPVAPLFRFHTEAEAIAMANDTEYGLAAYFFTRDHARAHRVAEALEYGMVGHNTGLISNEVAPFGGIKQSGMGREGSRYGMDEYMEMKYICTDITDHTA
ncbi:NAD-dependent succinate-semialdehyde dehydrogenase [Komagataeibacter europaeus]|uniref:NAD-dependent succinate-semialdehyde dehydrogenase n=1 Tax=Komagataeibacter europaeus TaxID=33995 RepID=UPI000B3E96AA|nr:NAD-dependent succinate-semialdehyde dehydrogenase [Komagataeibacter europaeus]ARW15494.1 Succinate-semialdehyde dehydrogenase (NAD(P)(+)) [Komagataeibacter europaeus]